MVNDLAISLFNNFSTLISRLLIPSAFLFSYISLLLFYHPLCFSATWPGGFGARAGEANSKSYILPEV